MISDPDTENSVQLFQRKTLGFLETEVRVCPSNEVPTSIPTECTLHCESLHKSRPRKREDEVEAPSGGSSERHSVLTHVQREGFGRVSERYRTFTGGVDGHEEVDTCSNASETCLLAGDEEGETGEEEEYTHEWEGGEEKVSTAESVDSVDGWDSEEPVYDTCSEGDEEGVGPCKIGVDENLSTIVGNDVDTAELYGVSVY